MASVDVNGLDSCICRSVHVLLGLGFRSCFCCGFFTIPLIRLLPATAAAAEQQQRRRQQQWAARTAPAAHAACCRCLPGIVAPHTRPLHFGACRESCGKAPEKSWRLHISIAGPTISRGGPHATPAMRNKMAISRLLSCTPDGNASSSTESGSSSRHRRTSPRRPSPLPPPPAPPAPPPAAPGPAPPAAPFTFTLQIGQNWLFFSHWSMQSLWKLCRHGSRRTCRAGWKNEKKGNTGGSIRGCSRAPVGAASHLHGESLGRSSELRGGGFLLTVWPCSWFSRQTEHCCSSEGAEVSVVTTCDEDLGWRPHQHVRYCRGVLHNSGPSLRDGPSASRGRGPGALRTVLLSSSFLLTPRVAFFSSSA